MDLFKDVIASLNNKKEHCFNVDYDEANKAYNGYIINCNFSFSPDTLFYANEMNIRTNINNKMQYDFYYYGLPKAKRYNSWIKPESIEDLELIKEYYDYSDKKAKEVISVLSKDCIEKIRKRLYKGEVINDKRTRTKK